jgi:hypothetical protein
MAFMVGILESLSGGIARIGPIAAPAAVKDRRPPPGGEGVLTLVLDGEDDRDTLRRERESRPSSLIALGFR